MNYRIKIGLLTTICVTALQSMAQDKILPFPWPEGKKMAISLTFDDARMTNPREGTDLLDKYDAKATFFILPSNVEKDLPNWEKAVKNGHEMGNHSIHHPCSGNFTWSRERSLETYTMDDMRKELQEANRQIKNLLGVTPTTYAYPCGLTYLGRGRNTESFVPLIDELFLAGRSWRDEAPADPNYGDLAKLTGMEMDGKDFEEILPLIQQASRDSQWLILAGHETKESGNQTTRLATLEKIIQFAQDPQNGIWLAPMNTIAEYVKNKRAEGVINIPERIYPETGNKYVLSAQKGKGIGPKIAYMPEWMAFGWFTAKDRVEWDVEVSKAGTYDVSLDWSVDDKTAGNAYYFKSPTGKVTGTIGKTGSWETFKEQKIGKIKLEAGRQKLVFGSDVDDVKVGLLDLRKIVLTPSK